MQFEDPFCAPVTGAFRNKTQHSFGGVPGGHTAISGLDYKPTGACRSPL